MKSLVCYVYAVALPHISEACFIRRSLAQWHVYVKKKGPTASSRTRDPVGAAAVGFLRPRLAWAGREMRHRGLHCKPETAALRD